MTELINTSSEDTNQISWKKRFKSAFDNEHVFWTSLILWFIPIYIALPFLSSIIPSVEVIIILIILFPFLYLVIPIFVVQITTRYFSDKETSLGSLWQGETSGHEKKYVLYHVGFIWGIYFAIGQFGFLILMLPIALFVFLVGLKKGWLLQTDGDVERFRDYFTRLDKRQILLLLFMFIGLAPGMTYIGYLIIFIYIAAIIIHDKVKPSELGSRFNNIILLIPILLALTLPSFILNLIIWPSVGSTLLGGDKYPLTQTLYMYLVVGFGEEISFRVIFQTFMERRFGSQRGIVLTSLLFAICHIPSHFLGYGLFLGSFSIMLVFYGSLLFGYVWHRTRNLWVISGAHMLNNSNATIIYNMLN